MSSYAFRARTSGEILTPDQLRQRESQRASFGATVTADVADAIGYDTVQIEPPPAHDPATQRLQDVAPQVIGGGWVQAWQVVAIPAHEIAAARAAAIGAAWERIKHERDRRKSLGVKVGEHWYHSDADSRIQQISLFVMGAAVPPVQWKTLTTSPPPVFVTMTQAIAGGIFQNTAASDAAVFAAAEAHRIAMEASATPESYDFSGGWPASIEDAA